MWAAIPLLLALLTTEAQAADFVVCQTSKGDGAYWQWRSINGKRCWYPGRRRIGKSNLRWVVREKPAVIVPPQARAYAAETQWEPLQLDTATEQTIGKLMRDMALIMGHEHEQEPIAKIEERDDSVLGEICCWPPLDKETNWFGVVALTGCLALAAMGVAMVYWTNKEGRWT